MKAIAGEKWHRPIDVRAIEAHSPNYDSNVVKFKKCVIWS
jgi:hypothetical protein